MVVRKMVSSLIAISIFATSFAGAVMATPELDLITVDSVTEAILYDNAAESENAEDVVNGNDYTVTASQEEGAITVEIEATGVKLHENAEHTRGYWIGFAVKAPDGATKASGTFGASSYENEPVVVINENNDEGIAFYVNAGALVPKTEATLQWFNEEGAISETETFVVDLTNVTLDIADYTPTVVNANIADYDEVRDVYDADSYTTDYDAATGIVTVEATGLKEHTNANDTQGYWTGFAVEAPENATQFKYAFGESADVEWEAGLTVVEDIDGQGKKGVAFITNAEAPKRFVKLQWFDVDGNVLTDEVAFEMNLDGVKLNWILEETVTLANSTGTAEVELETVQNDGVITVKYTAEALDKHANALDAQGYWVGFAVEAPNAEAKANITFGEDVYTNMALEDIDAEKKGIAFYTNAGAAEPKTEATLQWVDVLGNPLSAPTTFVIDLTDVVLAELPYIEEDAVKAAKIVDQANPSARPYTSYSVAAETDENGVILVDINMKNLKSHKNSRNESGHWTGFAVVAPDNATTIRYAFATDKESLSMTTDVIETGVVTVEEVEKDGVAFYTNAKNTPKKYVRLQWFDVNGDAITNATDFVMDLSGVKFYTSHSNSGGTVDKNYYTVTFQSNGGSVVASVSVKKEDTISAPAAPFKEGFLFDGWYIDRELTQKYDFSTPVTKSFTLYAKWVESENIGLKFADIRNDAWYYDVVKTVVEKGLMNGISETEFVPELEVTRAMFVTILYRAAGEPQVSAATSFADVSADKYYAKAVAWANANGIVTGVTESEFAPDNNITREQMAAILYRYAKNETVAGEVAYTDKDAISDYALDAVAWAKAAGIMEGNADGTFAPLRNASRAEAAAVFVRLLNL